MNVQLPHVVTESLALIGKATAGTAIFVAGLTISANTFKLSPEVLLFSILKNIALPVLFTGIAFLFLLQSGTPIFNQGLLLAALPSGPMIVLLATKYNQYQKEASSILALTTLGMMITVTALIAVLKV